MEIFDKDIDGYYEVKMTFAIYALLSRNVPAMTTASLEAQLRYFFRNDSALVFRRYKLPFSNFESIDLKWGNWLTRITYEEGQSVVSDSFEINRILGEGVPFDLSSIDRRIRLVFGADEFLDYTNEIIYIIDFLREMLGVILFDPQKKDLITLGDK